jgi:hypothetical protein
VILLSESQTKPDGLVNLQAHVDMLPYVAAAICDDYEVFWSLDAARLSDEGFSQQLCRIEPQGWIWWRHPPLWTPEAVAQNLRLFVDGEDVEPFVFQAISNACICLHVGTYHRLASLLAWVRDDYGDGEYSRLRQEISEAELSAARECRELVHQTVGRFRKDIAGSMPVDWILKLGSRHWRDAEPTDSGRARRRREVSNAPRM